MRKEKILLKTNNCFLPENMWRQPATCVLITNIISLISIYCTHTHTHIYTPILDPRKTIQPGPNRLETVGSEKECGRQWVSTEETQSNQVRSQVSINGNPINLNRPKCLFYLYILRIFIWLGLQLPLVDTWPIPSLPTIEPLLSLHPD